MKSPPRVGSQYSFEATLENWAEGLDYCAVSVPAHITTSLGTAGPVAVLARLNDSAEFKVSLFPVGGGQHYIRIKAAVRKETLTRAGERVQIRLTVLDRSAISYPKDLLAALQAKRVIDLFKSLPLGKQNFILRRIEEAVKPETRKKRIEEAVAQAERKKPEPANAT